MTKTKHMLGALMALWLTAGGEWPALVAVTAVVPEQRVAPFSTLRE